MSAEFVIAHTHHTYTRNLLYFFDSLYRLLNISVRSIGLFEWLPEADEVYLD